MTHNTSLSVKSWAKAAEKLGSLNPVAVVSGRKQPDDPETIALTAAYLRDFNRIEAQTATPLELYNWMLDIYPRWANPGSLWGGVKAAKH